MTDRGLKIALGVSLVANVFIIGAVAGALYMHPDQRPGQPRRPVPLTDVADTLTPQDRDAFRDMLRAQLPAIAPWEQDARMARRQAMVGMAAPTFDRAAVGALLARVREDDTRARGQMENAVLDFAAKLPANERAGLVEGLRQGATRRLFMKGARRNGPPPEAPPPNGPPPPP